MDIDITDDRIFCNDAGDDENLALLNHYFVERNDFQRFYDRDVAFKIVKARKGTGKSALLRRAQALAEDTWSGDLFVPCKGAEIIPDFSVPLNKLNPIGAWQRSICARINREIGSRIKVAMSDDRITAVEAAEIDNFRGRNLLGALCDRFTVQFTAANASASVRAEKPRITNESELLARLAADGKGSIWLLVDDIDATFKNTEENIASLSAFFSACRELTQKVHGLVIRCAVRTDVWTILRRTDEALDKCEQYVFNLRWDADDVASILVNKVYSYFELTIPGAVQLRHKDTHSRRLEAFYKVFPVKYPWGQSSQIDSQKYLAIYSQGRPRWTAKLCRYAAQKAALRGHHRIEETDVKAVLKKYSFERRSDIVGEHSHEYGEFNSLLQIFHGWKRRFTTKELLSRISNQHTRLIASTAVIDAPQIAHLLYRAGILNAVKESNGKRSAIVEFEDRPTLLTSRANLDEGHLWEIPMFLRAEFAIW